MILTRFDQFHLLVPHNHKLEFQLQGLKFPFCGTLLGLIFIEFVHCVATLIVWECWEYAQYWKIFHSNSCISKTTGLIHSTESSDWKVSTFGRESGQKNINPDCALKSRIEYRHKFSQSDNLNTTRSSDSFFSKSTALKTFFTVSFLDILFFP